VDNAIEMPMDEDDTQPLIHSPLHSFLLHTIENGIATSVPFPIVYSSSLEGADISSPSNNAFSFNSATTNETPCSISFFESSQNGANGEDNDEELEDEDEFSSLAPSVERASSGDLFFSMGLMCSDLEIFSPTSLDGEKAVPASSTKKNF
jgi:hypothetical protein